MKFFKLLLFFLVIFITGCDSPSEVSLTELKCEYRINPLGIDNPAPRLSWKLSEDIQTRGQKQTAYQVLVASSLDKLNDNTGDVWDSGKVESINL